MTKVPQSTSRSQRNSGEEAYLRDNYVHVQSPAPSTQSFQVAKNWHIIPTPETFSRLAGCNRYANLAVRTHYW
jgi:hypothetical protein